MRPPRIGSVLLTAAGEQAIGDNRYIVRVERLERGWEAAILDPEGAPVFRRACASKAEADRFASTVRQHIHWLSPGRFRRYYRIPDPPDR